jgi:hypothetical protein
MIEIDGELYCKTWLKNYTIVNSFVYIVSFGIMVINIILKAFLRSKY